MNSSRRDNKNLLRIPEETKNKGIITHFWIKYRKELIAGAIAVLVAVLILIITSSGVLPKMALSLLQIKLQKYL